MKKRKKTLLMAGYAAALTGFVVYFFTKAMAGMMVGGLFLCITSFCKILLDWKERK